MEVVAPCPVLSWRDERRQLEVLHAIMRSGTPTAAAQLLNVSQPAVSKILRHLMARIEAESPRSVSTSFAG
jgi:predicted transcriptional regulator